ncbi:HD domain-containing protein [Absiella sp. AM29-15]|uniref:HD domain-containing protein n=1 Tax=Absiella sp. AM29-15 TaxID=2292278 RepID=UPI000E41C8B2|nr:HD domain-containing protein [Absiella sp. AM29-15]RGC51780.1 bifunctional (p)ppGpp synthetase/guanosine-3',5'-bis(diphosphate) 3'-pyrophosphohydrolase [Absiella sp. AM29-15]
MIYTELTNKAIRLAYQAHNGQVDKAGMPYILHPIHLAEQMDDEISTCVAILHDVVEDTDITFKDLEKEFPESVLVPLRYLTHEKNVPYMEYVQHILENDVAIKVKLADNDHNMDQSRFSGMDVDEKTMEYFRNKYTKAKALLCKK